MSTNLESDIGTNLDGSLYGDLNERIHANAKQIQFLNSQLVALRSHIYLRSEVKNVVKPSWPHLLMWFGGIVIKLGLKAGLYNLRTFFRLGKSGMFDSAFYASQTGQSVKRPEMLLRHYISHGHALSLDPSEGFSVSKYLDHYPDVRSVGAEPFSHYIYCGHSERRTALISTRARSLFNIDLEEDASGVQDDRQRHAWPAKDNKSEISGEANPFDVRPDDCVLVEAALGDAFIARFNLLSGAPDFEGAVAYLNSICPESAKNGKYAEGLPVSVIIPVYGQLPYTLNCIHSLFLHKSDYEFEIIIGDDGSLDPTSDWVSKLVNVRYVRHGVNGGFVENCNKTADIAQGNTIVFLNNDTRVADGWLDQLLNSFQTFPKAGLVGSKLFYPDGSLQEAGGIVWRDGSAWNYGRDDDPNRPRYCYARQVDYVSGCSIAISKTLWEQLGGFDVYFKPAYCEDVDLFFRVRRAGQETWYQPQSRVIHYEGKTSGTDTNTGVKSYQITNTVKFSERWRESLSSHRVVGKDPWLEKERQVSKRVLIIDACNPTPKQDAGSVSIINLFKYYQALGYQVNFAPENLLFQDNEVGSMQAIGVQCFYAPFETSIADLMQKYGHVFDVVHVIRADVASKLIELIHTFAPNALKVYQNSDLHFLRMQRQSMVENKPELLPAAAKMKEKELLVTGEFDVTIVHSDVERKILTTEVPGANVVVMPLIEQVVESTAPYTSRSDVMFLGGYGHPPNVDAAIWIIDELWPAIESIHPEARLLIVGARPPKELLDRASNKIIVTGLVDDLQPWFDKSKVFLAALRYGAGSKGKVLASLAYGVPVIGTDIAMEGLGLQHGKDVFIANDGPALIGQVNSVLSFGENEWGTYSREGKCYIERFHSFESAVELLREVISR